MKYYHNMPCAAGANYNGQGYTHMAPGGNAAANGAQRVIDCEYPLAMAYVPWQKWGETYPPDTALCKGTLFPELYLPYTGCQRRNCHG